MFFIKCILNYLRLAAQCLYLKIRYRLSGGEIYIDYGWIKLIFSNDNDMQEILYHANCFQWYNNDMAIFRRYIQDGANIIDVGANLGFVSVILASLVGSKGKVFSFEASKRTFSKLIKTVSANNLEQIVIPYNLGCGKKKGKTFLNTNFRSSGNYSIVQRGKATEYLEEIEIIPLDLIDELWKDKITFIKIDVEGFESEVLLGAKKLILAYKPTLYLEMSGYYIESRKKCLVILDNFGYKLMNANNIDWIDVKSTYNFIALPHNHKFV